MACPKDSSPPKPSSRLNAHANSAKHITFIMNTGYTPTSGAPMNTAAMMMKATRCVRSSLAVSAGLGVEVMGVDAVAMAYFCVPNKPAGRISSTMVMMMKMTVVEASG